MTASLKQHNTVILLVLLLLFYIFSWLFPPLRLVFGILLVLTGFALACSLVIDKHHTAYFQAEITREIYVRNVVVEVCGIAVTMVCAALAGRYLAELATRQIEPYAVRFILGILVGLSVGIGAGLLVRKTWNRFWIEPK